MTGILNKIKFLISYPILIAFYILIKQSKKWELIRADMQYYMHDYPERMLNLKYKDFVYLMVVVRSFRNVLYYRLKKYSLFIRGIYPPQNEPLISCDTEIGGGLFFCHGFSTIVVAKSIGKNCWINQQETIGANSRYGYPTIGDDVFVFAGALVIGDIKIGNNVVIGAGAVVTKDVPDNCVVVGNPARIIRRNGIKVNEDL